MNVFRVAAVGLGIGSLFLACSVSKTKTATDPGSTDLDRDSREESLAAARLELAQQAKTTPDNAAQAAFLSLFVKTIGESDATCGCPGSGPETAQEGALRLDDETSHDAVVSACAEVGSRSRRSVSGDGGCWFRANAVCLAGLSQGLAMGKVWIVGDVRDVFGGLWNFHVANTYDGRVYDAGFGMFGVSLDEWQKKFSGDLSKTRLIATNCASFFQGTVVEPEALSSSLVEQICDAAQAFGGVGMRREVTRWLQEASENAVTGVVPPGTTCPAVKLEPETQPDLSELRGNMPRFSSKAGVAAACLESAYLAALGLIVQDTSEKFKYGSVEVRKIPSLAAAVTFSFESQDAMRASIDVTAIVDKQCKLQALLM